MKTFFQYIKRIFNYIFNFKNMGVLENNKYLNHLVNEKFEELRIFFTNPSQQLIEGTAPEYVQIKQIGESVEFHSLSNDYVITRNIDGINGACILKTHKLAFDENDYPKKKMVHLPLMDIIIRLPFNSQESFRFIKDDIVSQTFGKNADGTPSTVNQNKAYIVNFPLQYISQLLITLSNMPIF